MLAGRALYSLIIPLANTSPPRTVSEGCGLWERNRIKEGMTLPGYWRLPLFPRCPSAGCNNPVALLLSPPRDSAQMHWVDPRADLVVTEKQKKKEKQELSLSSCTSMWPPMWQEKQAALLASNRRRDLISENERLFRQWPHSLYASVCAAERAGQI